MLIALYSPTGKAVESIGISDSGGFTHAKATDQLFGLGRY
jgi:hypothetical protein